MKKFSGLMLVFLHLSGCGLSTFTQRETDPFLRDYFTNQTQPVALMVTDSSRRLVYEFKDSPNARLNGRIICADASPDTSIAASGAVGGDVTATINAGAPNEGGNGSLSGYRITGASTLPLVRRSQGLQWGRDSAASECLLFAMGVIDRATYLQRLDKIREMAVKIIEKEIDKGLGDLQLGDKNPAPESKQSDKGK